MTARARIHYGAGLVVLAPMPDGFPYPDLCTGTCRGCGGTTRREFPMPDSHRRRIPRLRPRDCHECVGTGAAHVDRTSAIGRALQLRWRPDGLRDYGEQVPGAHAAAAVARVLADPYPLAGECPGCGQQSAYSERCPSCVRRDREPQGSQDALFTPTAAPIPGQLQL